MKIRDYIKNNILLFDGAMGTYFSSIYTDPLYRCEYANITSPHTVSKIHLRYLQAGAMAIKTNTFSVFSDEEGETAFSPEELITSGYGLATETAEKFGAYVFCDIGPITKEYTLDISTKYKEIIDVFINCGGTNFLFETFPEGETINSLAEYIKSKVPDSYIIASFAIDAEGFTKEGFLGTELLKSTSDAIDSCGFNCICGPHHMTAHVKSAEKGKKPLSIMPNASYPTVIGHRLCYENNPQYFAKQMMENVAQGADIIGGCCGTTPMFIKAVYDELNKENFKVETKAATSTAKAAKPILQSDFYQKLTSGDLPIAVELDSPVNSDTEKFMAGAAALQKAGTDIITIADCPVARARMDSSLLACKIKRELSIPVLPHMTCRDRNVNATRALLLGLACENITDVMVITGDPVATAQRSEVKAVYEFNSRKLIQHISGLNQTLFDSPFYLYAALNINARNFDVQLSLAKDKIKRGAMAFFTQPVLSKEAFENLKRAKEVLNVPIVGGILPIVSYRNATFINNEIPGITVCKEIMNQYIDKSRDQCSKLAVEISTEIAAQIKPYIDGYYIVTPFQRVDIVSQIITSIKSPKNIQSENDFIF